MITNTTTLTKEDIFSTERFRRKEAKSIVFLITMIISGSLILYVSLPYLLGYFAGTKAVRVSHVFEFSICSLFALFFIFFGFYYPRWVSNVSFRNSKQMLTRTYSFTEEGIEVIAKTDTVDQNSIFKYASMTGYFEMRQALYVELMVQKRKLYLIIHDDGYTEGRKEDAIKMLKEHGVQQKQVSAR